MSAEERLMIAMVLLGGIGYRSDDVRDLRRLGLAAIRHLTLAVEAIG